MSRLRGQARLGVAGRGQAGRGMAGPGMARQRQGGGRSAPAPYSFPFIDPGEASGRVGRGRGGLVFHWAEGILALRELAQDQLLALRPAFEKSIRRGVMGPTRAPGRKPRQRRARRQVTCR